MKKISQNNAEHVTSESLDIPNPPLQDMSAIRQRRENKVIGFFEESHREALIMMVDDEETTIDVLRMFLEDAGYNNFTTTTDSRKALAMAKMRRPDVLLLDLKMPHIGGFEILDAMHNDESLKYIPVIILTSAVDAGTKLTALERGATDFLGKPVDPSELALRIRNILTAKAYQDSLIFHDSLTGLPNRQMFGNNLTKSIYQSMQTSHSCAVIHLDLYKFHQLNDSLGHQAGDVLLKSIAQRLESSIDWVNGTETDQEQSKPFLARIGGDEFAVIVPDLSEASEAVEVANHIHGCFVRPFVFGSREFYVTASMGVSICPQDGDSNDTLLRKACAATAYAKEHGLKTPYIYSSEINAQMNERFHLEHMMHRALEKDQLKLVYQPKICVNTGHVIGAETLMRWELPGGESVSPEKFIPIAEETGLILPFGEWAFKSSCQQLHEWQMKGYENLHLAVNVSPIQFQDENFLEYIATTLQATDVEAHQLTIEVTETLLMQNVQASSKILSRMRELGLRVSIDDFGTGYSSLNYLKNFSADELKIDRSFLSHVPEDRDNCAIIKAIVGMARGLGLSVVAEGIENTEQLDFIRQEECDEFQGFLVGKPMPADEFENFLKASRKGNWQLAM